MIAIIDYGLGNPGSIKNMLKKIGVASEITRDIKTIESASKLILPGVGSFDNGMQNLSDFGLIEILNQKVKHDKIPVLGICLGMQLMTKSSEEGKLPGLGWIDAVTLKFRFKADEKKLPVPNMGWEHVKQEKESRLLTDMYSEPRFYFVHSFFVKSNDSSDTLLTTTYSRDFVSGFEKDNIVGVQFHPEKSHKYGMKMLSNFIQNY